MMKCLLVLFLLIITFHGSVFAGSEHLISVNAVPYGTGVASGADRVGRGGDWFLYASYCTVAGRRYFNPIFQSNSVGFRVFRPWVLQKTAGLRGPFRPKAVSRREVWDSRSAGREKDVENGVFSGQNHYPRSG